MPLISLIGGAIPWRLVAIIGGVLFAMFALSFCTAQVKKMGALETQLDQSIEVANANAAAAAVAEKLRAAQAKIAEDAKAAALIERQKFDALRRKHANAAPSENGPIAPVLRHALDQLPGPAAANP